MSKKYVFSILVGQFIFFALCASLALAAEYRYCSIPAGALIPLSSDTDYRNEYSFIYTTPSTNNTLFSAPVYLPDGAEIVDATAYGLDTDLAQNQGFAFYLARFRYNGAGNPLSEAITPVVQSNNTDGTSGLVSAANPNPTPAGLNFINNHDYSYGLVVGLPPASSGKAIGIIRIVVRAKVESVSNFHSVVIK